MGGVEIVGMGGAGWDESVRGVEVDVCSENGNVGFGEDKNRNESKEGGCYN